MFVSSTDLIGLGAGQTTGQSSTAGGQGGGEGWAAVRQDGLHVAGPVLRRPVMYSVLKQPGYEKDIKEIIVV